MRIILIVSLVCSLAAVDPSSEKYSYREHKGTQKSINIWTRGMTKPGRIELTVTKKATDEFDKIICDAEYHTIEWFYTNNNKRTNLNAVRIQDSILLSGEVNGKPIKKTIGLETAAWYQQPEFALSHMLMAQQDSVIYTLFWVEKMSFYVMKAVRIGEEKIQIDGKDIDTIKVKVTLTGVRAIFWSSKYWFRKSDFLFVKFEGVNGIPGTDATLVELAGR